MSHFDLNLQTHLVRQMEFSHDTFGPGVRTTGVIDHIRKELVEVETSSATRAEEWVDVVILAIDGLTRELAFAASDKRRDLQLTAALACKLISEKQARNEARTWPDWRAADPDKAIEHDRSGESR